MNHARRVPVILLAAALVALCLVGQVGAVAPARAAVTREWTYMVYLDGDNNLEDAAVNDFLEMSSVGSTPQVAVVAQMDRIIGYDSTYDDWTDTRRFYITEDMTPAAVNGTSIGEAHMGAEATLVAFVQWAQAAYPANRYALILWDHGSGWRSRALNDPLTQGIAYDDTSGGDGLSMVELRNALSTLTGGGANPFDLIGMDACLMAMIEVDDQLRPYADVRVTSQEVEPNDGAPQDAILEALVAAPTMTTEALATVYVDEYYASYTSDFTQSAVDLGADYAALRTAVDGFAGALLANGAANAAGIQAARSAVQDFDFDYYIDLYDFAAKVAANVTNAAIDNAAAAVMAALGPATIHEHHGTTWPGAHGISIYFPKTLGEYDTRYDGTSGFLQFTAATQWDEWLRAYHAYPVAAPANDDWGAPTVIDALPYTNTQDVAKATTAVDDPLIPCAYGGPDQSNRTVWYRYVPGTAEPLTIDTVGSGYDTQLAVWTGSRGNLTNVACSEDDAGPGGVQSSVHFTPAAGTTYFIEIASYFTSPANPHLVLNVSGPVYQEAVFPSAGANDGLVIEQDETSGKGGTVDAASIVAAVGDSILDYQYRSILHFETGLLPDDAVIVGITLKIKKQKVFGSNPFDTHGYLTVDMKTGTYHDNPVLEKLDFHAVGSRGNVGRFIKTPAEGWFRAPLRLPSYPLLNLAGPTQFRLRFATDDDDDLVADYLSFYTGNAPAADRPQLIVTFYEP